MIRNEIHQQLIDLGLSTPDSIYEYYPKVRDRDDISVLKCKLSGVLFLSRIDHMDLSHYTKNKNYSYWSKSNRKDVINSNLEDIQRRYKLLEHIIKDKKWIDIGTGSGGILDKAAHLSTSTSAVEPQEDVRLHLKELGYEVFDNIQSVANNDYEVVTLFHVFEHLTQPIDDLKKLYTKMCDGGRIIIEVPHANDFLLSFLDDDSFKEFTFWSEHLILHTKASLFSYLQEAGFKDIVIEGCQRYPLANHLHWLKNKKPGGHTEWNILSNPTFDEAYSKMLSDLNMNDTLIAYAQK